LSTVGGGVSLLTSHIKNTHFKAIKCRICRVFVAESRAEMSRHVYRTHMYDKKFYTKQFRNLVRQHTGTTIKAPQKSVHQKMIHPEVVSKGNDKIQAGPRQQPPQISPTHLQRQQNIYCVL
jgi:hypothetical protein